MAYKKVAVVGCTLQLQLPVVGSATFTGLPSTKIRAGGSFAYLDNTQVTVPPGAVGGGCTTTVPGIGNMPATAQSVKDKNAGKLVLRVDDEVTISGVTGVLSGGGACSLDITVKVSDAGQTKVSAQ